jgi:uncharacterized delta-60 repeat protein
MRARRSLSSRNRVRPGPDGAVTRCVRGRHLPAVCAFNPDAWGVLFVLGASQPLRAVDGGLDASFGTAGRVATPIPGFAVPAGVAIQPDGKVVAAGFTALGLDAGGATVLVRWLADGTLDATFGTGGVTVTDFLPPPLFGSEEGVHAMLLDPDGSVVTVGYALSAGRTQWALARHLGDGTL